MTIAVFVLAIAATFECAIIAVLLRRLSDIGLAGAEHESEVTRLVKQTVAQSQVICDRDHEIRRKDERIVALLKQASAAADALIQARGFINQAATELDPPF